MNIIEVIMDIIKKIFGKPTEQPKPETPVTPPVEPPKSGNYYPRLLRVTNVNPETNGGIIGADIEGKWVSLKRKSTLYVAICCEVQVHGTIKLEAITRDEFNRDVIKTSQITYSIDAKNSGAKSHRVDIPYPNAPNGYITGNNTVNVFLYDQNGRECGRKSFRAHVEV